MFASGGDPASIVKAKGLLQVEDEGEILRWVEEILAANPKIVADIKAGKESALGALVGQVMKKSGGRANPPAVNRLLRQKLSM
jgi:aspartyl-tRNA(Asn)/glutamyl-tRNA(Gln) amidotransferase subunit B